MSYGTTQIGRATPPRADTHFRIASNTKTMTAAVIIQMAQEGKLELGNPCRNTCRVCPNGEHITLAELLEMRSGLYNYLDAPELAASSDRDPTRVWTPEELLAIAFAHPPNFPPGTEFEYNNTNYALLGLVAERVDGKPLARAMQDRLFGPLGLKQTALPAGNVNTIPEPYSHGYLYGSSSVAFTGTPPYSPALQAAARAGTLLPIDYTDLNHSFAAAAGGVISTASDLATGSRHWFPVACSTPRTSAAGSTACGPRTPASRRDSSTGTASRGCTGDRTRSTSTAARPPATTPSSDTTPPTT